MKSNQFHLIRNFLNLQTISLKVFICADICTLWDMSLFLKIAGSQHYFSTYSQVFEQNA